MSTVSRRLPVAVVIFLVLLAGFAVRWTGHRHGKPDMIFHPDVAKQGVVARLAFQGALDLKGRYGDNFQLSMYPYGTPIILGTALRAYAAVAEPFGFDPAGITEVHRWRWSLRLRRIAIFMFLAATAVTLGAMSSRFRLPALLLTGLLLAFEPINAQYSHYGMNDVPLVSMLMLAWVCADRMRTEPARLPLFSLLTGLCLGIGFGIKYQALLGLVFPGLAWLSVVRTRPGNWRWLSPLLVLLGFGAGALFTCPQLTEPSYFVEQFPKFMAWQSNVTNVESSLVEKLSRNLALIGRFAVFNGLWLLLPGLAWACFRVVREPARLTSDFMATSAAVFCCIMLVAFVPFREFIRPNDLISIMPFLIFLLGMMLTSLAAGPTARASTAFRLALWGLPVLLLISFAYTSILDSLALTRADTRTRAQAWYAAHLPEGAQVLREIYTLPVGVEGIDELRSRHLSSPRAAERIQAGKYSHLIASSLSYERFYDRLSPFYAREAQAVYDSIRTDHKVEACFEDRELDFAHPTITVYARE